MPKGKRAEESTLLGVSMPKELKERIKAAAENERRSMANWCVHHLEVLLDQLEDPISSAPERRRLTVADEAGKLLSGSIPVSGALVGNRSPAQVRKSL
jgi:predicted DNA-binding protein